MTLMLQGLSIWLTLGVLLIWVSIPRKALVFSCRTLHEGFSFNAIWDLPPTSSS